MFNNKIDIASRLQPLTTDAYTGGPTRSKHGQTHAGSQEAAKGKK